MNSEIVTAFGESVYVLRARTANGEVTVGPFRSAKGAHTWAQSCLTGNEKFLIGGKCEYTVVTVSPPERVIR